MASKRLDVKGLRVRYGQLLALRGVSIEVGDGEIVAVLGPNGAGKSTLLNCIAGLIPRDGGTVRFNGESLDGIPGHRRLRSGIALVPEGRLTFGPLTVAENLRLGMFVDGWVGKGGVFHDRLERVLELFPLLTDRLQMHVGDLSGGQQQMVAIGRALMADPDLLILDEPSLGLAPQVIDDVFDALQRLNEQHRLSVLIAEQNIDSALELAGRAYVLEVGRVGVSGSAAELVSRTDVEDVYLGRRQELDTKEEA